VRKAIKMNGALSERPGRRLALVGGPARTALEIMRLESGWTTGDDGAPNERERERERERAEKKQFVCK
jgi:hypothetical protein